LQEPPGAELLQTAEHIVRFLQGRVDLDSSVVADTVTLYISPEGGGATARVSRELLTNPANWRIESGTATHTLTPPAQLTELTTRAGSHFSCLEYQLATRYPELATLPHVGTKLSNTAGNCLQTWNLTLVFAPQSAPQLVGAVYDQWEW
jgi:hypothetical protein